MSTILDFQNNTIADQKLDPQIKAKPIKQAQTQQHGKKWEVQNIAQNVEKKDFFAEVSFLKLMGFDS